MATLSRKGGLGLMLALCARQRVSILGQSSLQTRVPTQLALTLPATSLLRFDSSQCRPFSSSTSQKISSEKLLNAPPAHPVASTSDKQALEEAAEKLPWIGRVVLSITSLFSKQPLLDVQAEKVYLSAENAANAQALLDACGFKRDFASWFKLTLLHLWIYFARLRHLGDASQGLQQTLLDKFWGQAEANLVACGVSRGMLLAKYMKQNSLLLFGFQVALDLGIRDGDTVLAGTLQRNLFFGQPVDAQRLAALVGYIHKQLHHLDKQSDDVVLRGEGTFAPF